MSRIPAVLLLSIITAACAQDADQPAGDAAPPESTAAQAPATAPRFDEPAPAGAMDVELRDSANNVVGVARVSDVAGGIEMRVRVAGLTPGAHGIHIHDTGRCEPPAFQSAGAHLDLNARQHGLKNPAGPHTGDLQSLLVRDDGTADALFNVQGVTMHGTLMRTGGTALVIHAAPDDDVTDPSGNSGARIACGFITGM